MVLSEFELIAQYFTRGQRRADVTLGVGDDAALLFPPAGCELVLCVDAMVAGRHFPLETSAEAIGYKSLAVNLSDLAAMGAEPAWVTLALSLPEADEAFVEGFARGFFSLAEATGVDLVGGDTVRGPLQVVVQAQGLVPAGTALTRAGAKPGDHIFVTGTLGDAGAGLGLVHGELACEEEDATWLQRRLDYPTPRLREGGALRGIASAAIDISDGLLADLGHILEASEVGATLELDAIPVSASLKACISNTEAQLRLALSAGDDYELCFTVPEAHLPLVEQAASAWECGYHRIGVIRTGEGITFEHGQVPAHIVGGFDHFSGAR